VKADFVDVDIVLTSMIGLDQTFFGPMMMHADTHAAATIPGTRQTSLSQRLPFTP
jgi:hypothetical protein